MPGASASPNVGYVTRNELSYDHTESADADPIAVLQDADLDTRDEITVTNEVHVPVSRNCDDDSGCLCNSRGPGGNAPWYLAAIVLVLRPRRRRSMMKR